LPSAASAGDATAANSSAAMKKVVFFIFVTSSHCEFEDMWQIRDEAGICHSFVYIPSILTTGNVAFVTRLLQIGYGSRFIRQTNGFLYHRPISLGIRL
jgi:hypothetical protein